VFIIKILHIDEDLDHHRFTAAQLARLIDEFEFLLTESKKEMGRMLGEDDSIACLLVDDENAKISPDGLIEDLRGAGNWIPVVVMSDKFPDTSDDHENAGIVDSEG
jgi:hypothetical protein